MEYFFEVGNLLPDQIEGITEITPMWGAAVGMHKMDMAYSFQFTNANAKGAKINVYSVEARKEVPISNLVGMISFGADIQGIISPGKTERTYYGGAHVGGGILALISSGLYIRMNMKFTASPGVSLFLGFGLLYRPSEDIVK